MIKVNFFALEHRKEPVKRDFFLGICDPDGEDPAYTTSEHGCDKWCAKIENKEHKKIQFIAIDKNIDIRKPNGEQESRCDGMIFAADTMELCFVELKDYHVGGYIGDATDQLLTTIEYFLANHHYEDYHNRRAFACIHNTLILHSQPVNELMSFIILHILGFCLRQQLFFRHNI